jgi:hypothetical protein
MQCYRKQGVQAFIIYKYYYLTELHNFVVKNAHHRRWRHVLRRRKYSSRGMYLQVKLYNKQTNSATNIQTQNTNAYSIMVFCDVTLRSVISCNILQKHDSIFNAKESDERRKVVCVIGKEDKDYEWTNEKHTCLEAFTVTEFNKIHQSVHAACCHGLAATESVNIQLRPNNFNNIGSCMSGEYAIFWPLCWNRPGSHPMGIRQCKAHFQLHFYSTMNSGLLHTNCLGRLSVKSYQKLSAADVVSSWNILWFESPDVVGSSRKL